MTKRTNFITSTHPKTLVIAVHAPYNPVRDIRGYFDEFLHLVRSNNISCDAIQEVKLRSLDSTSFFTKGKLEELVKLCHTEKFEEIIISEPLSVHQERTLQELLHARIFDRTALILEIFEKRAVSAEGKLQVELARLRHMKSRLAGRGIHLSQQGGSIGTRGPGETQKEKETQHIEHLMHRLRRELARIDRVRATQRKRRLQNQEPLICLVGYTNAGKSSILNALTHSAVVAHDQLFSTLDTTTRELYIAGKKCGLISDTVGFIQQLPPYLIDAFKSTLHELHFAHIILQVIDASDPNWKTHLTVVNRILDELGVTAPMVYVFNKIDKLTPAAHQALLPYLPADRPIIMSSTLDAVGMGALMNFLRSWCSEKATV